MSVPVVLFIFKRLKAVDIIKEIKKYSPQKLYLIADGPRNEAESQDVFICRNEVEKAVDWECEIIKNYAEENRGVYRNIGEGAKWVFSQEEKAIFLEDDNLPAITFFEYCEEMLNRYESEDKVLWICGSNYLEEYQTQQNYGYLFSKQMLPCGWASWSKKFLKYYDGMMTTIEKCDMGAIRKQYYPRALFASMKNSWMGEYRRIQAGLLPTSWDYQMDYSIKANDLYGIVPTRNQIKNIGIDSFSIHGGVSKDNTMTERFCERQTHCLEFPLHGPESIVIDRRFESKIGKLILPPFFDRIKWKVLGVFRKCLRVSPDITTKEFIKNGFRNK